MVLLFSLLAIGAALGVVLWQRVLYAALSLCLSLFSLAGLFYFLQAPFAALIEVLVYLGAIMTLFIFVIMLTASEGDPPLKSPDVWLVGGILFFSLLATLGFLLWPFSGEAKRVELPSLMRALYQRELISFEAITVLLLVSIVAIVYYAKLKREPLA